MPLEETKKEKIVIASHSHVKFTYLSEMCRELLFFRIFCFFFTFYSLNGKSRFHTNVAMPKGCYAIYIESNNERNKKEI